MKLNILSRFIYIGFYALLNILLTALLLITPGDAIRQALDNNQLYNVFVISGSYFLTLTLAIIIYTSRLYAESAILKAIPKTWIPIENGDVNRKVRKMVLASLNRSAVIAWHSRPRMPQQLATASQEPSYRVPISLSEQQVDTTVNKQTKVKRPDSKKSDQDVIIPTYPVWGEIAHDGWSSPMSADFPNLQYITVILELPNLIEAKAVSLTTPHIDTSIYSISMHMRALEMLQRPAAMGLRDYIDHLTNLNVATTPEVTAKFISLYEYSRFSGKPLSEMEFRSLMSNFSELLRGMKPLDPDMLVYDKDSTETDFDNNSAFTSSPGSNESIESGLISLRNDSVQSGSNGTIRKSYS